MPNTEHSFKISFLGEIGTGKTKLIKRYIEGAYKEHESYIANIGKNSFLSSYNDKINLEVLDTANTQGRFATISSNYNYRGTSAYVIVFDVNDKSSLTAIDSYWFHHLERYINNNEPVVIVGAKADGEHAVISEEEAQEFVHVLAYKHHKNISYFGNVSAKKNIGVSDLFEYTVKKIIQSKNLSEDILQAKNVSPSSDILPSVAEKKQPVSLLPLLLELTVPEHVKETLPKTLPLQVDRMRGYVEDRLHISLGKLYVNMENKPLAEELLARLNSTFTENPLPKRILLNAPQEVGSSQYFGMPVKSANNDALQSLYNAVVDVVLALQEIYTDSDIAIEKWEKFQAHVTLFGGLTEKLQLPDNIPMRGCDFIPAVIQLRNNADLVHRWDISHEQLLQQAQLQYQEGLKELDKFKKQPLSVPHFQLIKEHFTTAGDYYKNCDQLYGRISCLMALSQLSASIYIKSYGSEKVPTSYFNGNEAQQQQANHRLRSLDYALETAQLLTSVPSNELDSLSKQASSITEFLSTNKKVLESLSNVTQKLRDNGIEYNVALETIDEAIANLENYNSKRCSIM